MVFQGLEGSAGVRARVRMVLLAYAAGLVFLACFGVSCCWGGEVPSGLEVSGRHATSVEVSGVINPNAVSPIEPAVPGVYQFLYRASESLCTGAGKAPEPAGLYLGVEPERVSEELSGLSPGTTYSVCLAVEATKGKAKATSSRLAFTTAIAPETPEDAPASPVAANMAGLHGVLDASEKGEAGAYHFDYRAGSECEGDSTTPPTVFVGEKAEAASAIVSGLTPATEYSFCLVAVNTAGEVSSPAPVQRFTTPAAAPVPVLSSADVTDAGGLLLASVNPGNAETAYSFEVAPQGGAYEPVTGGQGRISASTSDVQLSVPVTGLSPSKVYEARIGTQNVALETEAKGMFTTRPAGLEFSMLDGRSWEQISPPQKNGATLAPISYKGGVVQAADNGTGMTYSASGPIGGDPEGNDAPAGSQILSTRNPDGGWSSRDIAAPHALGYVPEGEGFEYKLFSSNLEAAILNPEGASLLPAPTARTPQEQTIYLRDNTTNGFQPIINEENIRPEARLGNVATGQNRIEVEDATSDLHHVFFISNEDLPRQPEPGIEPAGLPGSYNIYEWNGEPEQTGSIHLASILPQGESSSVTKNDVGDEASSFVARDAVSTDGTRLAWTGGPSSERLYVTDMTKHESLLIAAPSGANHPTFEGANAQGTRIFFYDPAPLVANADTGTEVPMRGDLYVYEVPRTGGPLSGTLRDLSLDSHEIGGSKEDGNVLGNLMGYGGEGSGNGESMTLYFVDTGILASNRGAEGMEAQAGGFNLYAEHLAAGVWQAPRYIAGLSAADGFTWGVRGEGEQAHFAGFPYLTSGVSGSGRYLLFMSSVPLMGYDNRDVVSGVRDEEVFVYDADSGKLSCVSCDPSGARPRGILDFGVGMLADEQQIWTEHWLAGSVPGSTPNLTADASTYHSRYVANSGRVFFDSPVGLVPGDVNRREDVYEFEPVGVGSCSETVDGPGAVYSAAEGGCVGLVSSGTSPDESAFLDAGGMGPGGQEAEDVFFLTSSRLSVGDTDGSVDVYDAHVCSGVAPCPAGPVSVPAACAEPGSCHGQAGGEVPPAALASELPAGEANATPSGRVVLTRAQKLAKALKVCKRDHKHAKRVACERAARRRYGPIGKKAARGSSAAGKRAVVGSITTGRGH